MCLFGRTNFVEKLHRNRNCRRKRVRPEVSKSVRSYSDYKLCQFPSGSFFSRIQKIPIQSGLFRELGMSSPLYDGAVIQHEDLIRFLHGF